MNRSIATQSVLIHDLKEIYFLFFSFLCKNVPFFINKNFFKKLLTQEN